jgi:hypothetical protein
LLPPPHAKNERDRASTRARHINFLAILIVDFLLWIIRDFMKLLLQAAELPLEIDLAVLNLRVLLLTDAAEVDD